MSETSFSKIAGIIEEMKGIENQLGKMPGWDDAVGGYMKFQFQDMKRELLKELMIELIKADIDLTDLDPAFSHFVAFLSRETKGEKISPTIKSGLQEVERLMATA
ncbi:MAG: hypothetical protein ACKVUS_06880 [Saprospiraceae bacterium]